MATRRDLLRMGAMGAAAGVAGAASVGMAAAHDAGAEGGAAALGAEAYAGPRTMPQGLSLLSIRNEDGSETLGAKSGAAGSGNAVLDVRVACAHLGLRAPLTLEQMLREGSAGQVAELLRAARENPAGKSAWRDEAGITHGRLFRDPAKIVCVGLNYRQHAIEIGAPIPKFPVLFSKFNNTLAAHGAPLRLPPPGVAVKFDYETELVLVVGRHARDVPEAEALSVLAGYCTGNDFSARDLQIERGGQWLLGKTLDGFAPIGPYFVSADLVGDPNSLKLETRVNGEVRQSSSTSDFIFNVQQVIAYITRHWSLAPGDIIFTGTPQGVILGKPKDQQVWLKAGDRITSSLEKLGELHFTLA
jgi:2-keto-4-pentenoate hydratase/2-oxohepta-3-ene-1,7-dioic acid hydratase in catechol pathway